MSPACVLDWPKQATGAEISAQARARLGLPDGRDREPGAAEGWRWWASIDGPPTDLLQLAQFGAAVREGDDLSVGVAIPGAPGACGTCHHAKVWHIAARRSCELCACRAWAKADAA